jgi:MFS family permease
MGRPRERIETLDPKPGACVVFPADAAPQSVFRHLLNRPITWSTRIFAAFAERNFRLYAYGQLVSNTGTWTQRISQDWLVLTLTHSPTAVGVTTALQFVPTLMLGLSAGVLADRSDKRRILTWTQGAMSASALCLAALVLLGDVDVWEVYAIALGLGCVIAVDNPVRQAFLKDMVGTNLLRNAIALQSSIFQFGALLGPTIAGVLLSVVGPGWCFLINGLSYAAPIRALSLMRPRQQRMVRSSAASTRSPDRGQACAPRA